MTLDDFSENSFLTTTEEASSSFEVIGNEVKKLLAANYKSKSVGQIGIKFERLIKQIDFIFRRKDACCLYNLIKMEEATNYDQIRKKISSR